MSVETFPVSDRVAELLAVADVRNRVNRSRFSHVPLSYGWVAAALVVFALTVAVKADRVWVSGVFVGLGCLASLVGWRLWRGFAAGFDGLAAGVLEQFAGVFPDWLAVDVLSPDGAVQSCSFRASDTSTVFVGQWIVEVRRIANPVVRGRFREMLVNVTRVENADVVGALYCNEPPRGPLDVLDVLCRFDELVSAAAVLGVVERELFVGLLSSGSSLSAPEVLELALSLSS